MPSGNLLFAYCGEGEPAVRGWQFHPDGHRLGAFRFSYPEELIELPTPPDEFAEHFDEDEVRYEYLARRAAHFAECTGWTARDIRCEYFEIGWEETPGCSTRYAINDVQIPVIGPIPRLCHPRLVDVWQRADDPDEVLEGDADPRGYGGEVCSLIASDEFVFSYEGDLLWCDHTGDYHSTS